MKMKHCILFVCFAFLFESIIAARSRRQIFGGEDADIKNYPYQVSLRYKNKHGCGGVIISDQHILTAAHCVRGGFAPPFTYATVHTGTNSSTKIGNSHRIASVTFHPKWKTTDVQFYNANDLAILKLVHKIRFDANQQMIGLASHDVTSGSYAVVTGWGQTSSSGTQMSERLQMLRMEILSHADCDKSRKNLYKTKLYEKQICVYHSKGHTTCAGDSGGPIVMGNKLVGIICCGPKDCSIDAVIILSNVYAYKDFIEQTIRL